MILVVTKLFREQALLVFSYKPFATELFLENVPVKVMSFVWILLQVEIRLQWLIANRFWLYSNKRTRSKFKRAFSE